MEPMLTYTIDPPAAVALVLDQWVSPCCGRRAAMVTRGDGLEVMRVTHTDECVMDAEACRSSFEAAVHAVIRKQMAESVGSFDDL